MIVENICCQGSVLGYEFYFRSKICICIFTDRRRNGAGKTAAYLRFLLGIFADEFTSWSALEHGDWYGSKEDADKKIFKNTLCFAAFHWHGNFPVWNSSIYQKGFSDLFTA